MLNNKTLICKTVLVTCCTLGNFITAEIPLNFIWFYFISMELSNYSCRQNAKESWRSWGLVEGKKNNNKIDFLIEQFSLGFSISVCFEHWKLKHQKEMESHKVSVCFNEILSSLFPATPGKLFWNFLTFTFNILLQGILSLSLTLLLMYLCWCWNIFAEQTIIKSVHLPSLEFFHVIWICCITMIMTWSPDMCICVWCSVWDSVFGSGKKNKSNYRQPELILFWCWFMWCQVDKDYLREDANTSRDSN